MNLNHLFILISSLLITNGVHAQGSDPFNNDTNRASISGTVIDLKGTMVFGIDRQDLTIINKEESIILNL